MSKNRELLKKLPGIVMFVAAGLIYGFVIYDEGSKTTTYPVTSDSRVSTEYVEKNAERSALENGTEKTEEAESITEEPVMVDINSAGINELMQLNGIGNTRATAIIEYRSTYGNFSRIEDIMLVPGIKEGIFGKIKNNIYINEEISNGEENTGG